MADVSVLCSAICSASRAATRGVWTTSSEAVKIHMQSARGPDWRKEAA